WAGEVFQERVRPLEATPYRRPVKTEPVAENVDDKPALDWLDHLTKQHQPEPLKDAIEVALAERKQQDDELVELLRDRLCSEAFDESTVREFLDRYGPLDSREIADAVDLAVELGGTDQHVASLLTNIHDTMGAP